MPPVLMSCGEAARGSYFLGGVGGQEGRTEGGGQEDRGRRTDTPGCPLSWCQEEDTTPVNILQSGLEGRNTQAESTFTPHKSLITLGNSLGIINRPGVAGAVLQTALSLIN